MLKTHFTSALVAVIIIAALVLTGPAQALNISFTLDEKSPISGKFVNLNIEIDLSDKNAQEINNLSLSLNGPSNVECVFNQNGDPISGCHGIDIKLKTESDFNHGYGYNHNNHQENNHGYGYGYGFEDIKLSYEIKINKNILNEGNYSSMLSITLDGQKKEVNGPEFEVLKKSDKPKDNKIKICHIPSKNEGNAHTIEIDKNALDPHLSHGDYLGECNEQTNHNNNNQSNNNGNDGKNKHENNNNSNSNNQQGQKNNNSKSHKNN